MRTAMTTMTKDYNYDDNDADDDDSEHNGADDGHAGHDPAPSLPSLSTSFSFFHHSACFGFI